MQAGAQPGHCSYQAMWPVYVVSAESLVQVCSMLQGCARPVAPQRTASKVHCDLKPNNVLFLPWSAHWWLLDRGTAAIAGALVEHVALPSCCGVPVLATGMCSW